MVTTGPSPRPRRPPSPTACQRPRLRRTPNPARRCRTARRSRLSSPRRPTLLLSRRCWSTSGSARIRRTAASTASSSSSRTDSVPPASSGTRMRCRSVVPAKRSTRPAATYWRCIFDFTNAHTEAGELSIPSTTVSGPGNSILAIGEHMRLRGGGRMGRRHGRQEAVHGDAAGKPEPRRDRRGALMRSDAL